MQRPRCSNSFVKLAHDAQGDAAKAGQFRLVGHAAPNPKLVA